MVNQVLEATLAVMILLLAMSVTAIVRVDAVPGNTAEPDADGEHAAQAGWPPAESAPPMWPAPQTTGLSASAQEPEKAGLVSRGRYEARHVRGRTPKPRSPGPVGPPWGPAPPPGLPQQGSERLI
jgi:hypothetical protein